ncbi:LysR family transcriptional regulator, partial [Cylindrospermopsis raciborskii CS-506_B]|nr:LysR family transcriptional regulator [Cylindrospermopsis raciborskii CS-506_B]
MLPSLDRLAFFTATLEAGSFTAAAARLGVTKSLVSQ